MGLIPLEETQHFSYKFKNTGTSGLLLEGVEPDCGACTQVEFPKDTINPGQEGIIQVTFDGTGRYVSGPHEFFIHVKTNTRRTYINLSFLANFLYSNMSNTI